MDFIWVRGSQIFFKVRARIGFVFGLYIRKFERDNFFFFVVAVHVVNVLKQLHRVG